jgi:predicted small lipoprotein YifL
MPYRVTSSVVAPLWRLVVRVLASAILLPGLVACGQRGPLTLPAHTPSSNAPAASAAAPAR